MKLNRDLDILKMYLRTENEVAKYSHSKGIALAGKNDNSSQGKYQGQMSPISNHF